MKKYTSAHLSLRIMIFGMLSLGLDSFSLLKGGIIDFGDSGDRFKIMVPTLMMTFQENQEISGIDAMIPVYASIRSDEVVAYIPPHTNVLALETVSGTFSTDTRECTPLLDAGIIKTNRFFKIENNASSKDGFVIFANPKLSIDLEVFSALYVSEADLVIPAEAYAFLSRNESCRYILENGEKNFTRDSDIVPIAAQLRVTHFGNDIYDNEVIKNYIRVYADPDLLLPAGLIVPEINYLFSAYKMRQTGFSNALPCSPQYQKEKLKLSYQLHFSENIKIHNIEDSGEMPSSYWIDEKFISDELFKRKPTCDQGSQDPLSEALVYKNLDEGASVENFGHSFASGLNIKYTVPIYLDIRQTVEIGSIAIKSPVRLIKENDKSYDIETLSGSPLSCQGKKTSSVVVAITSDAILLNPKYKNFSGDKWINAIFLKRDSQAQACGGIPGDDLTDIPPSYSEGRLRSMDGFLVLPVRSTILSSTSTMHSPENPYPLRRGHSLAWDLTTPFGLSVNAVAEGVIDYIGCNNGGLYGCWVLYRAVPLSSGTYKYNIVHAHLSPTSLNKNLRAGSRVTSETVFGTVSCAGLTSFGPHVHFEIRSPSGEPLRVDSVFNQAHMLQRDFYDAHGKVYAQFDPSGTKTPLPIDLNKYDFNTGLYKYLQADANGCRPNLEMLSCFANLLPTESSLKCFKL